MTTSECNLLAKGGWTLLLAPTQQKVAEGLGIIGFDMIAQYALQRSRKSKLTRQRAAFERFMAMPIT